MHTTDPFILTYKNDSATCVFNWIFCDAKYQIACKLQKKYFKRIPITIFKNAIFCRTSLSLSLSLLDNHTLFNTAT